MSKTFEGKKNLNSALRELEKKFGKGVVMTMDSENIKGVEFISSGSLLIDKALGGGFPKGRIVEVYGPESSGKTTLALHAIAEAQKDPSKVVAFIDVEHALDVSYAKKIGVNVDELIFSQPDSGEQALEIVEGLIRSGDVSMIVVDSVAALVPEAEINGEMGQSHVGLHARLMSQAMRKLSGLISRTNTVAIFINQIREKVGVMFGNPETTTGGRALKFYSTIRMEIRRGESQKEGNEFIGGFMNVRVLKNKIAPPYKTATVGITFGEGVDKVGEIIDLGVELDLIKKAGSWYSYNGDTIKGQGKNNFKKILNENKDILDELTKKIKEA